MTEMVVAAFDSPSVAEAAVRDLENARIPSADIKSYTKDEPTYARGGADAPAAKSALLS